MNFLRSVIADARPRKSMVESSNSPSPLNAGKTRRLDGASSGAEVNSLNAADQTSHLSTSLPIRENASDFNVGDAPVLKADTPVNENIQEMASNVEPEPPNSVTVDKSSPTSGEEWYARLDIGDLPNGDPEAEQNKAFKAEGEVIQPPAGTVSPDNRMRAPLSQSHNHSIAFPETYALVRASGHEETEPQSSPASFTDTRGKELTDSHGNSSLQVGEGTRQLGVHETTSSAVDGNTAAQGKVAGATAADVRRHSANSIKDPEVLTNQADATPTTAFTSPASSRRTESSVFETSLVPPDPSPNASANPTLASAAATVSHGAGAEGDLQQPGATRVFDTSDSVSGRASTLDNSAGRNDAEKELIDGGKARQVSPRVFEQADTKRLSELELPPRPQEPDDAKGVLRDAPLVSRQAMAKDSHISSAISPVSGSTKSSSPEQRIGRPASPEALRSVPAKAFQTDLMPKNGDSFHSRAPQRSPERKHETPKVQIGQIDVIVEAPAQPARKPAPAASPVDLASRYYLRRL